MKTLYELSIDKVFKFYQYSLNILELPSQLPVNIRNDILNLFYKKSEYYLFLSEDERYYISTL
jgi:hypothetical protein